MVRRTDELFGFKFGKNKSKADTALSWDKASKIIEKDLRDFVNSHQEVDWYNRGKPEIRDESEYITISSMTGAELQFIYSKDGTGVAIVDGPDIKPQKFNCTVAGNRISNNIGDAYNCFIRVDKEQGKINAKKNQKYRKESLNRRNRNLRMNEDIIKIKRSRKTESSNDKIREFMDINNELIQIMGNARDKVDDFAFLSRSLGDVIPNRAREEVEYICRNILSIERMLRELKY